MAKLKLKELLESEKMDTLTKDLSFEDGMKLMEELLDQIEDNSNNLDFAVNAYSKGSKLLELLKAQISAAEKKLEIIN